MKLSLAKYVWFDGMHIPTEKTVPIIHLVTPSPASSESCNITNRIMPEYVGIVMNKNDNYSHWLTVVY